MVYAPLILEPILAADMQMIHKDKYIEFLSALIASYDSIHPLEEEEIDLEKMMLKNKVALITGGSSGIGMAIAQRFLKEGAKIVITGRSKERCDSAQKQLNTIVVDAVDSATGDVSKWDDVQKMVEA